MRNFMAALILPVMIAGSIVTGGPTGDVDMPDSVYRQRQEEYRGYICTRYSDEGSGELRVACSKDARGY